MQLLEFNPLNTELNPICHLLALLGAHHILHVSGLRVNPMHNIQITLVQSKNPSKDTSLRDQLMKQRGGGGNQWV
jgi:hypothetical protein